MVRDLNFLLISLILVSGSASSKWDDPTPEELHSLSMVVDEVIVGYLKIADKIKSAPQKLYQKIGASPKNLIQGFLGLKRKNQALVLLGAGLGAFYIARKIQTLDSASLKNGCLTIRYNRKKWTVPNVDKFNLSKDGKRAFIFFQDKAFGVYDLASQQLVGGLLKDVYNYYYGLEIITIWFNDGSIWGFVEDAVDPFTSKILSLSQFFMAKHSYLSGQLSVYDQVDSNELLELQDVRYAYWGCKIGIVDRFDELIVRFKDGSWGTYCIVSRIFGLQKGDLIITHKKKSWTIPGVCDYKISGDDKYILASLNDQSLAVYNVQSQQLIGQPIPDVAFYNMKEQKIYVTDSQKKRQIYDIDQNLKQIDDEYSSPDGKQVAKILASNGSLGVYNGSTDQLIGKLVPEVKSCYWVRSDRIALYTKESSEPQVYDTQTMLPITDDEYWSPNSKLIGKVSKIDQSFGLYRTSDNQLIGQKLQNVKNCTWSADSKKIVIGFMDGTLARYNAADMSLECWL